jgi:hypothetical protein
MDSSDSLPNVESTYGALLIGGKLFGFTASRMLTRLSICCGLVGLTAPFFRRHLFMFQVFKESCRSKRKFTCAKANFFRVCQS